LAAAARPRVPGRPHVFACTHLANSASLLLPVSNLINLLAFGAAGISGEARVSRAVDHTIGACPEQPGGH
jgi:hypothetical protein